MSSMRNAVARRPHRERAQPLERRRLGLLEKHKDYSLRAKDFNKKKAQLKNLKDKAAERNEDEFYFGMMSRKGPGSRVQDGKRWSGTVEGDRGNKAMDVETVRLLKTQDLGYIRTMRQVVAKEVARLEEQVVLTRGFDKLDEDEDDEDEGSDSEFDFATVPSRPKEPRKIVFMDDEEQREETILDLEEDDADKTFEGFDDEKKKEEEFERAKALRRLRRQLENARKKLKALTDAEGELEIQRAKMAKTATSGGTTRKGKKIMVRTRKR
ncbi:u3 small nucleolar RNA-associated 11 [Fusarium subglutinans]|uniref:U3 small nucleolar RNA-associated protein 11 n=1 Tax=Gibberella subglutinans TaxID=42677 RepID=A0A8H5V850_GIBSU|nr:u3 small nucleolar RNA-associated 11 [Fusarium subglutinans]KAF5611749.1 u3 small nucleolar RNA-associated 11 [Fusarium subglutinans]